MHKWNGKDQFPVLITIFSAANYCDAYKNKGAVIKFSGDMLNIQQFVCNPHPYLLPNFMNLFTWSIPFVCEKVSEMLLHLTKSKTLTETQKPKAGTPNSTNSSHIETQIFWNKVKSISRMIKLFKVLREQNEDILKLKGLCPDNKLPKGVLLEGSSGIKDAIQQFEALKKADMKNEKRPADG
eukprot:TRINITY_DN11089_c0_g4_i5.p1 TRINITY_DN11089_c0_g4~~TRINITY_DN11089_c0_g4_i5.p1  ORF type:complete len:182 (+),score=54.85 TRINITY_DN11089_c0_g4_i5:1149-1694(+)